MVGNGNGGHLVGFGFFEKLFYICCAIEQGVLSMAVKVGELHIGVSVNVFVIKKVLNYQPRRRAGSIGFGPTIRWQ
jgi:hypothetical protein